jgi:hypothetical protein
MHTGLERVNTPATFSLTAKFDGQIFTTNEQLAQALRDVAGQIEDAPQTAGLLGNVVFGGSRVGSWAFKDGIRD